jgi:hypothetical protein
MAPRPGDPQVGVRPTQKVNRIPSILNWISIPVFPERLHGALPGAMEEIAQTCA